MGTMDDQGQHALYEARCARCGRKTVSCLWRDACLEPYRDRGREWEQRMEANRLVVREREKTLGW